MAKPRRRTSKNGATATATPSRSNRAESSPNNSASPARQDPRNVAADAIEAVILNGERLDRALRHGQAQLDEARDRALFRELTSGVIRWYFRLAALRDSLLNKPLKDPRLEIPLLLGLYQIAYTRVPEHAAVSTSVALAQQRGFSWAKGLVNAVLRRFLREQTQLCKQVDKDLATRNAYPDWMVSAFAQAWPNDVEEILLHSNLRAPLTLRLNASNLELDRTSYLANIVETNPDARTCEHAKFGLELPSGGDPRQLPGFEEGHVSVQDAAAQLTAELLCPPPGARVLDACAAPGGKSAALLERYPGIHLTAIDISEPRVDLVRDTFDRLGLAADVGVADAGATRDWWDGQPFDYILIDAPCTATGIIRRQPDIKLRRTPDQPYDNALQQRRLLDALWPLLAPTGQLLYATCSILPIENRDVVDEFLLAQNDAQALPLDTAWGRESGAGRQILPGEADMDGFFYALLGKI